MAETNFEVAGTELNSKFTWKYLGEYNKGTMVNIPNGAVECLVLGSSSGNDYGWVSASVIIPLIPPTRIYFSAQTGDTTLRVYLKDDANSIEVDNSSTSAKQRIYYR